MKYKLMEIVDGNITAVAGITALGKHIGIKKVKQDFAVIVAENPCSTAAVYTKNRVKGAPLLVTKSHLAKMKGRSQAIVINSGVANVCTGKQGMRDAEEMTALVGKELGIKKEYVLVASTGIIGKYLPMDKIRAGTKGIKNALSKESTVAQAILTTDTIKKEICVTEDNFTIAAIAKGSGMIHPNMATMLAFITTDAAVAPKKIQTMLRAAIQDSFNMMTVDMDTSTSDMAIVLATGTAGKVNEKKFQHALTFVCQDLAKKIAKDGEGATKLIEVHVKHAKTKQAARTLAKAVVSSNLVKCAVYGNDPNWGRILCALGNANIAFDPTKVTVFFGDSCIVKNGITTAFDYAQVKACMDKKEFIMTIDLHSGTEHAVAYGCDMTEGYIKINAQYHT